MPSPLRRTALALGLLATLAGSGATASTAASSTFRYDSLYSLMLAEFAILRNQTGIALQEYAQQARTTHDDGVTERALQIANYLQDSKAGLPLAQQWTSASPDKAKAYYQLAYHALKQQQYDTAIQAIDRLLALEPEAELEALFLNAYPANAEGRSQLLSALAGLEATYPDNAHLLFAHGLLVGENGDYATALGYMARAHRKNPDSIPITLLEARLLALNKQSQKAVAVLDQALARNPKSQQLNLHYVRALIAVKDYNAAEARLTQLLKTQPSQVEMLMMHGLLAYDHKHDEAASVSFRKLIALDSNADEAHYYLAMIAKRQGRLAEAEAYLSQISEGERYLSAQMELAALRIDDHRLDQATRQFDEARQQQPEMASTLYVLESEVLNDHGQPDLAYATLAKGIARFPNDNLLLFTRALMADKRQELAQFELDMLELLRRDPGNPSYMNAYGYTLADKTGRLTEAEPYLRAALKLKPNDPAVIDSIGWLLYKQGHLFEALTYIRKAFAASLDEEIGLHLAEILWVTGHKTEARKVWRDLLTRKPNSEPVLKHRVLWEKKA